MTVSVFIAVANGPKKCGAFRDCGQAELRALHEFLKQGKLPFIAEYSADRMVESDRVDEGKTRIFSVGGAAHDPVVPIEQAVLYKHFLPVDVWILMLLELALQRRQFVQEVADATKFRIGFVFGISMEKIQPHRRLPPDLIVGLAFWKLEHFRERREMGADSRTAPLHGRNGFGREKC
jgi:hypothetical protein